MGAPYTSLVAQTISVLLLKRCVAARGFKALKQVVKLHYKLGNHNEMLQAYRCGLCADGRTDKLMQTVFSNLIRL